METKIFVVASGIALVACLIFFLGFYPGCFEEDCFSQYSQAVSGTYNDWHPVWDTLLVFTLPMKLTGGWTGSIVLFQIVCFSLLFGYMADTFYIFAGTTFTRIVMTLLLFCPFTLRILMYPWKDNAFSMASCASMLFTAHIYLTEGKWCRKSYRLILLAFMLTCSALFRHNGILFSFFLLIALIPVMQRNMWLLTASSTVLMILLIRLPLYSHLTVESPDKRILETTGLPLSIIVSTAYKCPEKLDEQTKHFVNEMLNKQSDWESHYHMSGFNSIKSRGVNNDAIERAGIDGIIRMTFRCFAKAPWQSIMAFVRVTIPVYGFEIPCDIDMDIIDNEFGIGYHGIKAIKRTAEFYAFLFSKTPLRVFFNCIGTTILVMLAFILFKTNFKYWEDLKRLFLCVPILAYDFGTMLLLTGHDVRFFFVNFLVCPVVVLLMGSSKDKLPSEEKPGKP